jgi:hypothetical protein
MQEANLTRGWSQIRTTGKQGADFSTQIFELTMAKNLEMLQNAVELHILETKLD